MEKRDKVEIINPESGLKGKIGEVIETKTGVITLLRVLIDGQVFTFNETEIMRVNTKKGR